MWYTSAVHIFAGKWKLAARAAINTINGSIGGALFAILYSCRLNKKYKKKLDVPVFTAGILGGLVGITAICTICRPWEAFVIGAVGGLLTCTGSVLSPFFTHKLTRVRNSLLGN